MALLVRTASDHAFASDEEPGAVAVGNVGRFAAEVYTPASRDRFWLPDPQDYAIAQERARHEEALFSFGEYAMFVLMWRIEDHERGLVDRCPACYTSYGRMAEAYGQPAENRCPECFGTTFEGGYRAKIVRPTLWDDNEPAHRQVDRGERVVAATSIQTTPDFRIRSGDYALRGDGTRWMLRQMGSHSLATGFRMPLPERDLVAYNVVQGNLEDPSSVAYMIPPDEVTLRRELDVYGIRRPKDFSDLDVVRGALIP